MTEPLLCAECEAPATRFVDRDAPYDPHCETCYCKFFAECGHCGAVHLLDELGDYQTCAATRMDPAEYEPCCPSCRPSGPDEDSAYDNAEDDDDGFDERPYLDWED
jgi:hypothetical protein